MINNKHDTHYSIDSLRWFNTKEPLEYKKICMKSELDIDIYILMIKNFIFMGFFPSRDVVYDTKFIYSAIATQFMGI